jgi:hypothetical protein
MSADLPTADCTNGWPEDRKPFPDGNLPAELEFHQEPAKSDPLVT